MNPFRKSNPAEAEHQIEKRGRVLDTLPVLPLRQMVYYPYSVRPVVVGQPHSIELINDVEAGSKQLGLVASRDPTVDKPGPSLVYRVGTLATIHRLIKSPDGTMNIIMQGLERIRVEEFLDTEPYLTARVTQVPDRLPDKDDVETEALVRRMLELFGRLVSQVTYLPDELALAASNIEDARELVYVIASSVHISVPDAQHILEVDSIPDKIRLLIPILTHELEVLELGKKIQSETQSSIEKTQREYVLREQLKAIQRELGDRDDQQARTDELRAKIEQAGMPEEAANEALRELKRLEKIPTISPEYGITENYLEWMTELPWSKATPDQLDVAHARRVLDEDHYDLEKVKDRIIEFLAVRKLRSERAASESRDNSTGIRPIREGAILAFVGPPGVGKTSLGQSIARALGRRFTRLSLGGVHDEAEIRGHRRTYIGALPGRIIQVVRRVGTRNPVIMLDEVDKLSSDWRGDPSSALLEVLDPEQNKEFRDNYLGVPFDLSSVMFIATANILDTIPGPLRDRMELLQLPGYTDEEKLHIARKYLIPREIQENGLRPAEVYFEDQAVRTIISDYTREAGVRELDRQIGTVCRKIASLVASQSIQPVTVDVPNVRRFLGKAAYFFEAKERTEIPGVATGLAVTATGGDILFIEATAFPGNRRLTITGQLGNVMKESVQAALSYIRTQARQLGCDEHFFEKHDVHVHVPAGAVPKDGPSAGIAIATAIGSLVTGRLVRFDTGMTGEITLRGKVLPVGGIKEKVLAAQRAGLTTVVMPRRNEKDIDDIPKNIRDEMRFILVDTIDEVLAEALQEQSDRPLRRTVNQ